MKYCSDCAGPVSFQIPPGDTFPRYVCGRCSRVFYRNPRLVVGTLTRWEDRILLCRRAIEPRLGYWTLPSGFLENGETVQEGALRETFEEAGALVSVQRLFAVFSLPKVNQVYLIFLARLKATEIRAGDESLEVALIRLEEIPWKLLAFRAIEFAIERYVETEDPESCDVFLGQYTRENEGVWIKAESQVQEKD